MPTRHRTAPFEIAPDVFCLGPWGRTQTDVYLVGSGATWVLIDAGWQGDAERIERGAAALFGVDSRPAAILLTHVHPDHSGAALALARRWGCRVFMHPAERPIAMGDFEAMRDYAGPLDRWVILPMMRALGARRRRAILERSSMVEVAVTLEPGEPLPGLDDWQCIHAPGHTPGHVAYFRTADRVLISGDAVVTLDVNGLGGILLGRQRLSGPPWYTTWDRAAAASTVRGLSALEPTILAGGHGTPLTGPGVAEALRHLAAGLSGRVG